MKKKERKLKIKTITYSRLKKTEQYENQRIEVTAEVAPGSDGTQEFRELAAFVDEKLGIWEKTPHFGCRCYLCRRD